MKPTLHDHGAPEKLTAPCAVCERPVVRCRDAGGHLVILEYCTPGRSTGTHTITAGLFAGIEPTATPAKGKGFRLHACPRAEPIRSHSAASFEGKRGQKRAGGTG